MVAVLKEAFKCRGLSQARGYRNFELTEREEEGVRSVKPQENLELMYRHDKAEWPPW